ncbi:ArsR/SmtB family transcription factor [Streptococcus cameli]
MSSDKNREYMDQIFNEYVKIGKALSSEKRIEILHRLIHGSKTVEEIARISDMTVANTSRHLQVLKEVNLVTTTKKGKYICYRVASDRVERILNEIHLLSEEQSPSLRYIEDSFDQSDDQMKVMTLDDAITLSEKSPIQLVDLRSHKEFEKDHIDGAVNIPYKELPTRYEELGEEEPVILYCRGRFCPYANQASAFLNRHGYDAYSVNVTHFDWRRG